MASIIFNELGFRYSINLGCLTIYDGRVDAGTAEEAREKIQWLLDSDFPKKRASELGENITWNRKFTATLYVPCGISCRPEYLEQTK